MAAEGPPPFSNSDKVNIPDSIEVRDEHIIGRFNGPDGVFYIRQPLNGEVVSYGDVEIDKGRSGVPIQSPSDASYGKPFEEAGPDDTVHHPV